MEEGDADVCPQAVNTDPADGVGQAARTVGSIDGVEASHRQKDGSFGIPE